MTFYTPPMIDPRERFTSAVENYARYRPGYTDEVVRLCADYAGLQPGDTVVDLGCGTGISSRLFARHGFCVTGVEPNQGMLARAREEGGGPEYTAGEAAATGLAEGTAGLVTAAQALHWFDMAAVAPEMKRITRPPHNCAAFWNLRVTEGWQADYEALLRKHSREYPIVRKASADEADNSAWVKSSAVCTDVQEHELQNSQSLDWPGLHGRAWSSSYMLHGGVDKEAFDHDLRELLNASQVDGKVQFKYKLYLILWRMK